MQCLFSKQPYKIERIQWQVTAFPQKKQKNTKNNSALKLRWMFHEVGAFKKTSNINLKSKIKNSCWPTCFRASGGCCDDAPAATSIILIAVVTFTVALCFSCSQQVQLHVTSYKQKQRHTDASLLVGQKCQNHVIIHKTLLTTSVSLILRHYYKYI